MITSAICSVKGIRSQKPRPQASTTCATVDGVAASAANSTMKVPASAKMKASGTQRSVHAVSASANRASGPVTGTAEPAEIAEKSFLCVLCELRG